MGVDAVLQDVNDSDRLKATAQPHRAAPKLIVPHVGSI